MRKHQSTKIGQSLIVILVTLYLIGAYSCKKNTSSSPADNTNKIYKVKSSIERDNFNSPLQKALYTYDSQGRISGSIDSVYSNGSLSSTAGLIYTYSQGLIRIMGSGTYSSGIFYDTLSPQGLVSSDTYNEPNYSDTYTYNSNNFLIKSFRNGWDDSYLIANNNTISDTTRMSTSIQSIKNYTFYSYPDNFDFGQLFLGRRNANLVQTVTSLDSVGNNIYTATYSYQFDSLGRVLNEFCIENSLHSVTIYDTTSYSYY